MKHLTILAAALAMAALAGLALPVGPLNPDGMNCKPIPSGTPTLCNRNGVVIAGRMSGGDCVTLAPQGQCYHKGQQITAAHWNAANPASVFPRPRASATGPLWRAGRPAITS